MGQKDILLKNYFTPDIFADAINAIVYDGKQVVLKLLYNRGYDWLNRVKFNQFEKNVLFRP